MNTLHTAAQTPRRFSLAVAIPDQGLWRAAMGESLADLLIYFGQHPVPGFESQSIAVMRATGSVLPDQRNRLVASAIEGGFTHLLFLDSDMTFPPDTVHRLAATGAPIAAVNASEKAIPPRSTAAVIEGGEVRRLTGTESGVVDVDLAGTGVMLIDLSILAAIPRPWFEFQIMPGGYIGEDFVFCAKARKAGYRIAIDADLSREVGHVGEAVYRLGAS